MLLLMTDRGGIVVDVAAAVADASRNFPDDPRRRWLHAEAESFPLG
jgi:hypothetical protein